MSARVRASAAAKRVCARKRMLVHEGALAISARVRARAPVDTGADEIDNNVSIPLWKQVEALVEISSTAALVTIEPAHNFSTDQAEHELG